MKALLDGDLYAFRSAASAEKDNLGIAIYRLEEMIDGTLRETGATEFSIFVSGDTNFRYDVYPEYKANRTAPKPVHLKEVKEYLVSKYNAEVSVDCEADDLLGIAQCAADDTIICSIDKDLRMIPGMHYSFEIKGKHWKTGKQWVRPMEIVKIDELDAIRRFYHQLLTGDATDNVKGAVGVGKVGAKAYLAHCDTEQAMLEAVRPHFSCDEELEMTGQCLWIFRKPNDRWKIPTFELSSPEAAE